MHPIATPLRVPPIEGVSKNQGKHLEALLIRAVVGHPIDISFIRLFELDGGEELVNDLHIVVMEEFHQWMKSKLLRHPHHLIEIGISSKFFEVKSMHWANLGAVLLIDVNHDEVLFLRPKAIIIRGPLFVIWILPTKSMVPNDVHVEHGVLVGLSFPLGLILPLPCLGTYRYLLIDPLGVSCGVSTISRSIIRSL
jgi:hypothetical protein